MKTVMEFAHVPDRYKAGTSHFLQHLSEFVFLLSSVFLFFVQEGNTNIGGEQ